MDSSEDEISLLVTEMDDGSAQSRITEETDVEIDTSTQFVPYAEKLNL